MRSSAEHVVARKASRSREHKPVQGSGSQLKFARGAWLVYSTKPTPSRDDMVAESRGAWCGGYSEFTGFAAVHHKTVGFLSCSTKPRLETRQAETRSGRAEKLRSGGHTVGSQGSCREDADCGKGMADR
jgi:hypothetical protein